MMLILVAMFSLATAFNNKATFTSMGSVSVLNAHTVRPSSRSSSTGMNESRVRSISQPSLSSSRTTKQYPSTRTRLQFSDNDSPGTAIESRWWKKIFTASSLSPNRSSASTSSSSDRNENEEQENVDAYLEFLDRRYRRLHSDDKKEEKTQSKLQASSLSRKGKTFSAMDWLTNGGSNNANVLSTTKEQEEDALYVLGVAGLASQKLLQKHHLPTTRTSTDRSAVSLEKVVELKEQIDDAIEINEKQSLKTKMNQLVLNNFLLPIIRVMYLLQRRKQLFVKMVQQTVAAVATKATDGVVNTLSQGPKSVLNTILAIGGGKTNILRTVAVGYATIILFRPLLQLVFAEGLAFDPMIK